MLLEEIAKASKPKYTGKSGFYCGFIVKNKDEVKDVCEKHNIECMNDLHVTVMYSFSKVSNPDLPKEFNNNDDLTASVIGFDRFGEDKDVLVVKLESPKLSKLHKHYVEVGAKFTWDEYHPHMTIQEKIKDSITDEQLAKFVKDLPILILRDFYFEDVDQKWKSS